MAATPTAPPPVDAPTAAGIDWANRHAINLARIEAGEVASVMTLLKKLEGTIAGILIESDIQPGQAAKLATIQAAASEAIGKTYGHIATKQAATHKGVAKMESAATGAAINSAIGADVFGPVLTENQWAKVANDTLIFGHKSGDWWASQDQALRFKFAGAMQEGYAFGESVDDLVRRVRGTKAKGYSDGLLTASRREAEALVRSSIQTISNSARLAGFEKTPEVVKGVKWVSTLDGRTTPICAALQGLEWRLPDYEPIGHGKTFPGPTAHWNCRSTQVAVLRTWAELSGKPIKALDQATVQERLAAKLAAKGMAPAQIATAQANSKASMDGQVPAAMDYQQWLEGKPDDYVRKLLGPGRFAMWKAGSLKAKDLTDQNNRPLTIAELQAAIASGGFPVETEGQAFLEPAEPTPQYPQPEFVGVGYHYTTAATAEKILKDGPDTSLGGSTTWQGSAFYMFANDPGTAAFGDVKISVEYHLKKPWIGTTDELVAKVAELEEGIETPWMKLITKDGKTTFTKVAPEQVADLTAKGDIVLQMWGPNETKNQALRKSWIDAGYDGLVTTDTNGAPHTIAAFNADSLKIAPGTKEMIQATAAAPGPDQGASETAVTKDAPEPPFTVTQVTLKADKQALQAEFLKQQGIDLNTLQGDDPVSADQRITEIHNALGDAGNVAALRDQSGKIVAAISWGQYPTGDVPVYNLGSIAPGGGSQALKLAIADATTKGKGIKLSAADPTSHPFYLKWGFVPDQTDPFWKTNDMVEFTMDADGVAALNDKLAAYIAGKAGQTAAQPGPDQGKAAAKIAAILADPKGQTLKAAALKKLQKDQPDLPPVEMLAMAEGIASEKQAAASKASVLSQAKKKLVAEETPTKAQWDLLNSLPIEEQNAFLASVDEAKKATTAYLYPKVEQAIAAAPNGQVDAATMADLAKLPQDEQDYLKGKIKAKQDEATADYLKGIVTDPAKLAGKPSFQALPPDLQQQVTDHVQTKQANQQALAKLADWANSSDPLKQMAVKDATAQLQNGILAGTSPAWEQIDLAEVIYTGHAQTALLEGITGPKATKLKQAAFTKATGYKGDFSEDSLQDFIVDNVGPEEIPDILDKVTSEAATKQAAASLASKLSTAKKKLLDGKPVAPAEQAAIDSLDPVALQTFHDSVADALAVKGGIAKGGSVTVNMPPTAQTAPPPPGPTAATIPATKAVGIPPVQQAKQPASTDPQVHYQAIKGNSKKKNLNLLNEAFAKATDEGKLKMLEEVLGADPDMWEEGDAINPEFFKATLEAFADDWDKDLTAHSAAHGIAIANESQATAPTTPPATPYTPPPPTPKKAAKQSASATQPDVHAKNTDLFVPDPSTLVTIKNLPGSTHPVLAQDPATGKQWVVKSPDQGGGGEFHLQNEATADAMYRIMGVPVPGSAFTTVSGKHYKVAEFLTGAKTLGDWESTATTAERETVYGKLRENFVMDALMGNWDVAGQTNDNIMVMPDGTPVRVDNGGALEWKAMGAKKSATEWVAAVTELTTLRDPAKAAGRTAQIFAGIPQADIHAQIVAIVAKRDELVAELSKTKPADVVETFKKRIDYLEKTLPAGMRKSTAAAKKAAQATTTAIPFNIQASIQKARMNGVALPIGTAHVEDMQALAWTEKDQNGNPITVTHLKVTDTGNAAIMAQISSKLSASIKAPAMTAPAGDKTAGPVDDIYQGPFIAMAKTLAAHKDDGGFNAGTMATFDDTITALNTKLGALMAPPSKTAADKAEIAMTNHYLALAKDIKATQVQYVNAHLGANTQAAIAKAPPVPFVATKNFLVEDHKDDPGVAKAKAAAAQAAKAAQDAEAARLSALPASSFTVAKRDKYAAWINNITNGHGTNSGQFQQFETADGSYSLEFPDGTVVTYVPRSGHLGVKGRKAGLVFEGTVQIRTAGQPTQDAIERTMEKLRMIGIDTTPPDADYRELVWLQKTVYQHNDQAKLDKILAKETTVPEKIKAARKFIETTYGTTVPMRGSPDYTADGVPNSYGEGLRFVYRADLPPSKIEKEMAGYVLQHKPWNSTLDSLLEGMLNSGGEATTTTGRIRKGVSVSATGGASAQSDIRSGGADFFFTRIRKAANLDDGAISLKIRNLARADAVTYTNDLYGETGNRSQRKSNVADYKKLANDRGSDETLLKNGFFLLDEIEIIRANDAAQRKRLLAIFAKHGVTHMPDGRKVETVVTL